MLADAVEKIFKNRNTQVTGNPTVLDPLFMKDEDKQIQWQGFIKKAKLTDAPGAFADVVAAIQVFIQPVAAAVAEGRTFRSIWNAPGPWR